MNVVRWLTGLLVMILLSCAVRASASGNRPSGDPQYRLEIVDNIEGRRFLLTLRSLDDRPLCFGITQWPNRIGQLHFGSQRAVLNSAEGKFPARDENFGYCVGEGCTIHIAPRASLRGFIGYAEFGKPKIIATLSKRQLHYKIAPSICNASNH